MNTQTRNLTTGIAFLLIGLSLSLTLNLTTSRPVRANPGVLYAAPVAQGTGNCSSWADACTLQTALTNANNGDEIWVKAGVHYPTTDPNDRTATFTLKSGVALYGGFVGTETSRNKRDWQTNVTIFSGDIDHNDLTDSKGVVTTTANITGTNAYHVVTGSGTDSSAVLDGFIITAGQANGSAWPNNCGGGMFNNDGGSPTLSNVIFSGNAASYSGGMRNSWYSHPTLTNVTFRANSAYYGSGGGMVNSYSNPTLTNVTFSSNSAPQDGGGIYNYSSAPKLTNTTFSGNSANHYGGGMHNSSNSNPALTNVIMWGNIASIGPGIYNDTSTPTIAYSDIQGCFTSGSWNGTCGTDGGNNIESDPRFIDATNGNLRLDFGSPAIDAGTNTGCSHTDLDGLPHPTDGNGNGIAACDIGAYEAGTMICGVNAGNNYSFNDQSYVTIFISTKNNLHCLYVDEMGLNHPQATTMNLQSGRYWLIRGLQDDKSSDATGFAVSLTLPTTFTPGDSDKLCRFTGSAWDCAASSHDNTSITRSNITAFSDWTVGRNVGPNAVSIQKVQTHPVIPWGVFGILFAMLALRRHRR